MRTTVGWVLAVFSTVLILLAVTAFWARNSVYSRSTFRQLVGESVAPEPVRRAIADRAVEAMLGPEGTPIARDLLSSTITGLLGSRTLRQTLDAAADLGWRVLVEREPGAVTLDLTTARDYARGVVASSFPELAARIDATPTPFVLTLLEEDALPSLAPYRTPVTRLAWILLAVGLISLVASFVVGRRRAQTTVRLGAILIGGAGALMLAVILVRVILPSSMPTPSSGLLVEQTLHVLTRSLATWLGILLAVGLVATVLANASRPEHPA